MFLRDKYNETLQCRLYQAFCSVLDFSKVRKQCIISKHRKQNFPIYLTVRPLQQFKVVRNNQEAQLLRPRHRFLVVLRTQSAKVIHRRLCNAMVALEI